MSPSAEDRAKEYAEAEAKLTPAQRLDEENKSRRASSSHATQKYIYQNARNPDSVKFEKILSNIDGTIICVQYVAQNGFGGMNRSIAVQLKDTIYFDRSDLVKKNCPKANMIMGESFKWMLK
jgi:hypothetical protein